MNKPPLIVILGPTAVGKTEVSIRLAERIGGEIVSSDSRLFYRGMDIGTAKPSVKEISSVPHHLIDIADPDEVWSLGKFKREALAVIASIHACKKVPLLVGGTGQYIRAITEGWVIPNLHADERLRQALSNWADEIGPDGLYQRLQIIDPAAADNILPGNVRRTIRALEVIFRTGMRFSDQRAKEPVDFRILQIGLNRPREELIQRIDARVDAMIAAGFVEEVRGLLDQGYSRDLRSMSALGYSQICAYLAGEIDLQEAIAETKRATKKFMRRQMTWFKPSDESVEWFDLSNSVEEAIYTTVDSFLRR